MKKRIYITTITRTGYYRASEFCRKHPNVFNFYAPIDLPFAVKNVIKKMNPEIVLITETELWPVLIHYLHKFNSKLVLINGRMTEKSLREYKFFNFIFKETISSFDKISVQTELDKNRFQKFCKKNVEVIGNIKFALSLPSKDRKSIRDKWKISSERVITFGSTRPGEEELAIELSKFLRKNEISHRLILAPRHLDRVEKVGSLLKNYEVSFSKLSNPGKNTDVLLIDRMGALVDAYAISDFALVGGSFFDFGGHNPLEPAYFGLPIVIGKYHSSCKESVEVLRKNSAIIISEKKRTQSDFFRFNRG